VRFCCAFFVVLALAGVAVCQTAPGNPPPGTASAPAITILEPQSGAKLAQDFVSVRYELSNPNAVPGTPNYRVQLDSRDAVQTSSTNQQFTGLTAGVHNVSVWLVDANGTPINGSHATVQFILVPPQPAPQPDTQAPKEPLPAGSSPLPLLSVVGLGVLCGGLISALKTR
jgi:hypothetical protein